MSGAGVVTAELRRSGPAHDVRRAVCRRTVLRAAPCLFGLYSVIAALYHALPGAKRTGAVIWPGKGDVTFSDALASVRRWLWVECVFPQAGCDGGLEKLPGPLRDVLLTALAPAA